MDIVVKQVRSGVLGLSGLAALIACLTPVVVLGQEARLEEVIVTAQKRAQSLQDVPLAVTAISGESLSVNRVQNILDISGLAPNLTVRTSGVNQASFSMRGISSFGSVPGSDRQVSVYLDGVYLGGTRGSVFQLPDIERIEVLRGPQGTLFGRNSTAGAISITTRDPAGEFGLHQELSFGNRNLFKTRTTVDFPEWGHFSSMVTYVAENQRGSVRNLGDQTVWDRTAFGFGEDRSPARLHEKDNQTIFFSARFDPGTNVNITYKMDHSKDKGSPEARLPIGLGTNEATAQLLRGLLATQPGGTFPDLIARRPSAVNNAFTISVDQKNTGHSLTSNWQISDDLSLKNISSYREMDSFVATDLTGLGGLVNTLPMLGPIGAPICIVCTQQYAESEQYSTEFQLNYNSDALTLTLGALYFHSEDRTGGPDNASGTFSFRSLSGYVLPIGSESVSFNKGVSYAAYAQAEYHMTADLDILSGVRLTRDEKSGSFRTGIAPDKSSVSFDYENTEPSYLIGINYRPLDGTLIYAKYSTAFVSGGSVGDLHFDPEKAKSWEVGLKSEYMNGRLRTNISYFDAVYKNMQQGATGQNVGRPDLGAIILDLGGDTKAKGLEFETTALVLDSLTFDLSLGYTDVHFTEVSEILRNSAGAQLYEGSQFLPTLIPRWTGGLSARYESQPIFDDAYLSFSVTGTWRSDMRLSPNPAKSEQDVGFANIASSPASWVVNGRVALRQFSMGPMDTEIALWGRNLTNNNYPLFALNFGDFVTAGTFMESRSYGLDLIARF